MSKTAARAISLIPAGAPVLEFDMPLYGGSVRLHRTPETLHADRRRLFGPACKPLPPADGRVCQITAESSGVCYLLGWFDGRASTLAHECSHIAFMALDRAGIDARHAHGEPHCHLMHRLIELCGGDTNTPRA